MRQLRAALIVACWTAIMPASAEPQRLAQSIRVRVHAPTIQPQPIAGSLVLARADTFMVAPANGREIGRMPVSAIQRIEISEGRNRRAWMQYGAIGGAVAVMALAKAANSGEDDIGLPIGGAVLGAIGGYLLAPERWRRVEYPTLTR